MHAGGDCWTHKLEQYFGIREMPDSGEGKLYMASLYWCVVTMTIGVPDWRPSNMSEQFFTITLAIVSILIIATVVGSLNDIIRDMQRETSDWNNHVRMMMATIQRGHVDVGLQRRVLSYMQVYRLQSERTQGSIFEGYG